LNRRGFGLLQALMIIVLISGLMMVVMKYAKYSIKQTKDLYIRESAELFMNSAVELSMLAISGYERNSTNHCLSEVNIISPDKRFIADVNITKYYLLRGSDDCSYCDSLCQPIDAEESHGMVMLEVTVETNNTNPKNHDTNISLRRRTLQRP
jgi:thioredoxin-related protein